MLSFISSSCSVTAGVHNFHFSIQQARQMALLLIGSNLVDNLLGLLLMLYTVIGTACSQQSSSKEGNHMQRRISQRKKQWRLPQQNLQLSDLYSKNNTTWLHVLVDRYGHDITCSGLLMNSTLHSSMLELASHWVYTQFTGYAWLQICSTTNLVCGLYYEIGNWLIWIATFES